MSLYLKYDLFTYFFLFDSLKNIYALFISQVSLKLFFIIFITFYKIGNILYKI